MGWEEMTSFAVKSQLKIFGKKVEIILENGQTISTQSIIYDDFEAQNKFHLEVDGFVKVASISKEDVKDPQSVNLINYRGKSYDILRFETLHDGYHLFFLSESYKNVP